MAAKISAATRPAVSVATMTSRVDAVFADAGGGRDLTGPARRERDRDDPPRPGRGRRQACPRLCSVPSHRRRRDDPRAHHQHHAAARHVRRHYQLSRLTGAWRTGDRAGSRLMGWSCPDGPIVFHALAIAQTMVEADGGTCDLASYGRYNGGFYHTKALADGSAHVATLVFSNFEARRHISRVHYRHANS